MKSCFLSTLVLFLGLSPIHATTWYVSNAGSNSNNGLSPGTAFLTIQFAENQCDPGDSVLVANGSYAGFYVNVSGTSSAPIVFMGTGNAVLITSPTTTTDGINVEGVQGATVDYIEINRFIVNNMPRNGIRLVWADNCIVRYCTCTTNLERGILTGFTDDILIEYNECSYTTNEHGIYVSNSSDRSIIRYNSSHHNHGGGIQINADANFEGDGISTDPEIYSNLLYENALNNGGGAAINLDGVQGAFIYNNLLYENHATGIALFQIDGGASSINAVVVYNTIVQASNGRSCVLIRDGATGAHVHNNILINQHPFRGSISVSANSFTGLQSDYNIVVNSFSANAGDSYMDFEAWQDLGYDLNSMLADPLADIFVNHLSGDYHLEVDAQAVNAGNAAFSSGVTVDHDGEARVVGSAPDMGAYEEQSVVLALEEDDRGQQRQNLRWTTIGISNNEIEILGLLAGDQVQIYDVQSRLVFSHTMMDDVNYSIGTEGWTAGAYVGTVLRQKKLLIARLITLVR